MADDTSASIVHLQQPPKRPKTAAERARDCRARKKAKKLAEVASKVISTSNPPPAPQPVTESPSAPPPIKPSNHAILLRIAALGLAAVGVTMNGWYARSLGSTEIAGWLFLAVGVCADLIALSIPACAAQQWQARNRITAAVAWVIWLMPFGMAVTAGIGFASVNIADVTAVRASRETPTIVTARNALADAMQARDRECAGGVGKFCRQREEAISERRRVLNEAMRSVEQSADPQTEAATRMAAWLTRARLQPTGDDFAMVRLFLLALLPQIGGILLMIARPAPGPRPTSKLTSEAADLHVCASTAAVLNR